MQVAKDIMRRRVITIGPDVTVGEAIDILIEKGISGLPVVDGSGMLVGVITEFALLAAAYDEDIKTEPVARHMTRELLSIGPETPIRAIADKFVVHRIRRVPVLERGKLVGSISRRDVLRAIQRERSDSRAVNSLKSSSPAT